MHEYDTALKLALEGASDIVIEAVTGVRIERWLNVELPEVRSTRVDMLGATAEGQYIHIELQSRNEPKMALRMAEYCLSVYRRHSKLPRQILLYVGDAPLRMESELLGPDLSFLYRLIDIRDLDGERLLDSDNVGDNVIGILARIRDSKAAVHRIVGKIAELRAEEREAALNRLLILAGLRHLEELVEEEVRRMPILEDIRNHKVLGREYQRGLDEGVQEGLQKGEVTVLRRQIEKRFGKMPPWAEERLASFSISELENLSERVLDAPSIEDLLH